MSSLQIVVVDDDILMTSLMASELERAGYTVVVAHDVLAAFDVLDAQTPAMIILDLLLPAANGVTFLHELRSHGDTMDIPVVLCTTLADTLDSEALQPYGVAALLDKTAMMPGDIARAVEKVLG